MVLAAKVIAATAYDLYTNPEAVAAAKDELSRRIGAGIPVIARAGTKTSLGLSQGAGGSGRGGVKEIELLRNAFRGWDSQSIDVFTLRGSG